MRPPPRGRHELDPDEQAKVLEELQTKLSAAEYGTQQNTDGPESALLDVWHPS